MADHPFANSGLGMFGAGESFAKQAMQSGSGESMGPVGAFLAGLIGLSPKKEPQEEEPQKKNNSTTVSGSVPPVQYEPQTAFPDILQQQYATPYKPGYDGGVPPVQSTLSNPMAGFRQPNSFSSQFQQTASGYHPATDALWGNR